MALSVTDVVNVTVSLAPIAAPYRNFGIGMLLGSSSLIDVSQRYRIYSNISGVAADFSSTSAEFLAASLYFSQSPQPAILYIGRWAQTATSAVLHGAVLTPLQQLITVFNSISNGSFEIPIDGVPYSITGLDFTQATNLNGVASIIQTALQTAGATGAKCVWGASNQRFDIISGSTGVTSTIGYANAPTATGYIRFPVNPATNDTITLGSTVVTFKASGATGNQVNIGANIAATLANALTFLRSSSDVNLVKFSYAISGSNLELASVATGAAGNSLTIAASAATTSAATLQGGSGTDVSQILGLYQPQTVGGPGASVPVWGMAAETLLQGVSACANASSQWYACILATATQPSDSDIEATAAYIEATGSSKARIFGVTINNTAVLDPVQTNDLASVLTSLGYSRTFVLYSSSSPYAVASFFGRAATVNFAGSNTTITMKFKQLPGVAAETLTETQAATLKSKRCNVFINYDNATAITQEGVMSGSLYFDERHGFDWLQNAVQTNVYNILYQFPKVPQTDAGMHTLATACNQALDQGVRNGLLAPGIWNGAPFGPLNTGDTLTSGYLTYPLPVALQAQADREARHATPIQIAAKGAGAIHDANIAISVNR